MYKKVDFERWQIYSKEKGATYIVTLQGTFLMCTLEGGFLCLLLLLLALKP